MNVALYQLIQCQQPEMPDFMFDGDLNIDGETKKLLLMFCSFPQRSNFFSFIFLLRDTQAFISACLDDPSSLYSRLNQKSL